MSEQFQGYQIGKNDEGQRCMLKQLDESDLMEGDVTVRVEYTTLNYKDGLALTGRSPIIRRFPLTPGIDFSGTVIESSHADFSEGDQVILNVEQVFKFAVRPFSPKLIAGLSVR